MEQVERMHLEHGKIDFDSILQKSQKKNRKGLGSTTGMKVI